MEPVLTSYDSVGDSGITNTDIDAMELMDIVEFADRNEVPLKGFGNVDDMKDLLKCYVYKLKHGSVWTELNKGLNSVSKENRVKREKLVELLKETLNALQETGDEISPETKFIEDLLQTEGTTENLYSDIQNQIDLLQTGEVSIMVSGETGSGKSTLLNLLLDGWQQWLPENPLPTHTLSMTSAVTRISYGPTCEAKIIFKTGEVLKIPRMDIKEDFKKYRSYVCCRDEEAREEESIIKEVHLKIPLPLLQCGLVLVDTPGVGENDEFNSVVADYVTDSDIMGFVYLIMSNAGNGGIADDRLVDLLKAILARKQDNKTEGIFSTFDPKMAVFVCNKWDLVKDQDKESLRELSLRKLSQCWPSLDTSQVIYLASTTTAQALTLNRDFLLPPFKHFVDRLKEIYTSSTINRTQSAYKWLDRLLFRSLHHLKTLVRRLDMTECRLQDKTEVTKTKLQNLETKADATIQNLKKELAKAAKEICRSFRTYLKRQDTQCRLVLWLPTDIPKNAFKEGKQKSEVKAILDGVIVNKIMNVFDEWEIENGIVNQLEAEIYQQAKYQLNILDEELDSIEKAMQEKASLTTSHDSGHSSVYGSREHLSSVAPLTKGRLPFKLGNIPFLRDILDKHFMDSFNKNPVKVAKTRTKKYLEDLTDETVNLEDSRLWSFVHGFLDRPNDIIHALERNIPNLIKVNYRIMNETLESRRRQTGNQRLYENMMTNIESLREHLMEYGRGSIFVDDFHEGELTLHTDLTDSGIRKTGNIYTDIILATTSVRENTRSRYPRGLWNVMQTGYITRDNKKSKISIRLYLPSAHVDNTYREVTKLRCLHHPQVADLLGIHRADAPLPAFVFDKHLKSARKHLQSTQRVLSEEIPRILRHTMNGLEYIHRKGLVHMELTLETITVATDGEVKLSGACLPRMATFPLELTEVMSGEFVHLSPEVLRGELYIATADIYSLGLVLLEVLLNKRPFAKQRSSPLEKFRIELEQGHMLNLDHNLASVSIPTATFIRSCLSVKPDCRPEDEACVKSMRNLDRNDIETHLLQSNCPNND